MQASPSCRAALLLGVAALLAACSPGAAARLRAHTYPPNFNYIPRDELDSTMWQLADRVKQLDDRMRTASNGDESLSADVVRILSEMEDVSRALGQGGWPSNHPRVSQNIEKFREDLSLARQAAAATPPRYFLAGSVSGTCIACHQAD